ncbi:hypothetical protein U1Q18_050561 [Sarracenia purpurea var. burkii]
MPDDFVSFIDKTLLRCSCPKLKKLRINLSYYEPCFASNFNLWTRFAAVNGTEELHLELDGVAYQLDENDRYVLPQLLFANSSFRKLHFSLCSVVPTVVEMLGGSPVLEILELYSFYGVYRLHITSVSVKKLILKGCWIGMSDDLNSELEISMPNLQSLEILGAFGELDRRLVDVTSLVEVTLDFDMKFVRQLNISGMGGFGFRPISDSRAAVVGSWSCRLGRNRRRKRLHLSLYSPSLKSVLGFNQQQLTILGVANDVGENVGVLPGIACNKLLPWVVLSVGVCACFLGYGVPWLAVSQTVQSLPYWVAASDQDRAVYCFAAMPNFLLPKGLLGWPFAAIAEGHGIGVQAFAMELVFKLLLWNWFAAMEMWLLHGVIGARLWKWKKF